jgi:hypothetical protein
MDAEKQRRLINPIYLLDGPAEIIFSRVMQNVGHCCACAAYDRFDLNRTRPVHRETLVGRKDEGAGDSGYTEIAVVEGSEY